MITLHVLQYLADNGFGTIDTDLFFEKLPLAQKGIAIFSRGGTQAFGRRTAAQTFDLYFRGTSDVAGSETAEAVKLFLADSYGQTCDLPEVPAVSDRQYKKVRFVLIGNIENIGMDENGRVMYRLAAQVIYSKEES
jgi:hypothetical protein